jgi:sugar/nucleoside kinase (ribokinase family)
LVHGIEHTIKITPHEGTKYSLAAGDTRNAGVLRALAHGFDMLSAFKIGTDIASVKIKYPGLTWSGHLAEELPDASFVAIGHGTTMWPRQRNG